MFLFVCFLTRGQEAMEFYDQGEYKLAALAFEREYFEEGDPRDLLYKAYSYKKTEDYSKAIRTLQRISTSDEKLDQSVLYEMALLNYLIEDYQASYNQVLRYKVFEYPTDQNLLVIEILDLIHIGKWQVARSLMMEKREVLEISMSEIEKIIPTDLTPKNNKKAKTWSYFIPGTGQMYAGFFGKGLVSGGLNAAAIAFTAYSAWTGYYFTGVFTGAALFYTFYLGGARHAGQLAEQKNKKISNKLSRKFKLLLE